MQQREKQSLQQMDTHNSHQANMQSSHQMGTRNLDQMDTQSTNQIGTPNLNQMDTKSTNQMDTRNSNQMDTQSSNQLDPHSFQPSAASTGNFTQVAQMFSTPYSHVQSNTALPQPPYSCIRGNKTPACSIASTSLGETGDTGPHNSCASVVSGQNHSGNPALR